VRVQLMALSTQQVELGLILFDLATSEERVLPFGELCGKRTACGASSEDNIFARSLSTVVEAPSNCPLRARADISFLVPYARSKKEEHTFKNQKSCPWTRFCPFALPALSLLSLRCSQPLGIPSSLHSRLKAVDEFLIVSEAHGG
jgi:hypothetical protein